MNHDKVDAALDTLVRDVEAVLGPAFGAAVYGSFVRGDWVADRSDVNVIVLLDDAAPAALSRLTAAVAAWHGHGFTPPLFIARDEWRCAADVFPVEITDMRPSYRMLHGDDLLAGIAVDPADLRRAIETELRGKLIRLRQAYVRFGSDHDVLGGYATMSVSSFLVLLRATAALLGRAPGRSAVETVASLADVLGPDAGSVATVAEHRGDKNWKCPEGLFEQYLDVVRRAINAVDTHSSHGDR